ncbi:MAG: hypothetical protein VB021_05020 [Oscillospiraceae bacterium]|nr:hypothetical protein [Oscillospiraceae bacterium]
MKYPNQLMASTLVGEEMKLFHSRAGIKTLSWCVYMTIWLESLFVYFFFVSRSMDRVNLLYLLFLAALFVLYLAATILLRELRRRSGALYVTDMIFASISYLVSAFSAYLLFSAAWRWHFADTVPYIQRTLLRPAELWAAAAALLVLAGYAAALAFEPASDRLIFGNYYWPGLFLPLLPEIVILLVSAAKQVSSQLAIAKALTPLCLAVLAGFAARYAVKAALYRYSLFSGAGAQTDGLHLPHLPADLGEKAAEVEKEAVELSKSAYSGAQRLFGDLKNKIAAHEAPAPDAQADAAALPAAPAESAPSADGTAAAPEAHAAETAPAPGADAADGGEGGDAEPAASAADPGSRAAQALRLIEAARKRQDKRKKTAGGDPGKVVFHSDKK